VFEHRQAGPVREHAGDGRDVGLRIRRSIVGVDEMRSKKSISELEVLLASGDELGDNEIVWIEAYSLARVGFGIIERNEPVLPSFWECCCVDPDALPVETGCLVESRLFSDRAVYRV